MDYVGWADGWMMPLLSSLTGQSEESEVRMIVSTLCLIVCFACLQCACGALACSLWRVYNAPLRDQVQLGQRYYFFYSTAFGILLCCLFYV